MLVCGESVPAFGAQCGVSSFEGCQMSCSVCVSRTINGISSSERINAGIFFVDVIITLREIVAALVPCNKMERLEPVRLGL